MQLEVQQQRTNGMNAFAVGRACVGLEYGTSRKVSIERNCNERNDIPSRQSLMLRGTRMCLDSESFEFIFSVLRSFRREHVCVRSKTRKTVGTSIVSDFILNSTFEEDLGEERRRHDCLT